MNNVQKMQAVMEKHDVLFGYSGKQAQFNHTEWGDLDVDTSDPDATLAALNKWVDEKSAPLLSKIRGKKSK
jgi:hypothetical protein